MRWTNQMYVKNLQLVYIQNFKVHLIKLLKEDKMLSLILNRKIGYLCLFLGCAKLVTSEIA